MNQKGRGTENHKDGFEVFGGSSHVVEAQISCGVVGVNSPFDVRLRGLNLNCRDLNREEWNN